MRQRYNFDRLRRGKVMAEGVAVHADTLEEANARARALMDIMRDGTESIRFVDNTPCASALRCPICATTPAK